MLDGLKSRLAGLLADAEAEGGEEPVKELSTLEELDACIAESANHPVLIFKHSTRCPTSFGANARVGKYVESARDAADGAEVYIVKVVEARDVSNAIEERLGVMHQSPQLILVSNGQAVWNTSHHHITPDAIEKALADAPA